jgi:endonuclease/exonuclease/phosphatase family metal-dependent hydrolase
MKLITYNIQIEPLEEDHNCKKRIQEISKYLKKQNADVICLQEVATPETKRIIEDICKEKYHIIHSNCLKIENIPKIAFYPAYISFILMIYFKFSFLYFLTVFLIPYFTLYFLYPFHKIIRQFVKEELDSQGLCILISREKFDNIDILERKPFNEHGYEIGWPNIFGVPFNWFQITYLRPGFTLLSMNESKTGEKLIICNVHLATGYTRSNRVAQIKELISIFKDLEEKHERLHIFVMGDFNVDESPEIDLMKEYMKNMSPNIITWDKDNNRITDDRNEQIDYIWYKSHNCKSYIKKNIKRIGIDKDFSDHYGICLNCSNK